VFEQEGIIYKAMIKTKKAHSKVGFGIFGYNINV
jgi:hypothetical protein